MFYPRILEHKDYTREVHTSEKYLGMDLFFPEHSSGVMHLLRNARCASAPRNFGLFRRIDLEFGGSVSWKTTSRYSDFPSKATDPLSTTFLRLLTGLTVNLSVPGYALIAKFASRFSFVILTYGRMPILTRRIRTVSFKVISARYLILPPIKRFTVQRTSSVILKRRRWCLLSTLTAVVADTASISF